ncbi:M20 family metallopeptidase [Corynebacterium flavescens]|uniref:M20 family metallopeptidase n=1 Tax=Corynebacterium flavescens TaxID=28028 RepID=UPI002649A4C3|nr:M20 family metallopeptidase [Corynebacterium flavescens]MDN6200287.1 M20 family metallopeptidase [Corynebacterium flavescens]MDN6227547.1 M20 family metallopeptidase [Corynebacterium flavescens]MDN6646542.1 M20 family metallopeptidase [Corynebacterium flavescens]
MESSLDYTQANFESILQDVINLVNVETGSYDMAQLKEGCDAVEALFRERIGDPDIFERYSATGYGDTLALTYEGALPGHVMLIGHYDTVWPLGTLDAWGERASRSEDGRLKESGPGIFDMKTGLVQGIWSLKALKDRGIEHPTVTFLINGDEERGSVSSRPMIEEKAKEVDAVLVLEPTLDGRVKVARKGVAIVAVDAIGIEAHAGLEPAKGASAITALMEYCLVATRLADPAKETTINVGIVKGGSGSNVVAGHAHAVIDIRLKDPQEKDRLNEGFDAITWSDERVRIDTIRDWNRPPMVFNENSRVLLDVLKRSAQRMGRELGTAEVGGGSDANYVSALNIPVICGLGAVGGGPHARHEFIYPEEIPFYTALVADSLLDLPLLPGREAEVLSEHVS